MIINVAAIAGQYATGDPEATELFAQVSNGLGTSKELIKVDFDGLTIVNCKFWAYSIARLLQDWDRGEKSKKWREGKAR
jgi:hypothetical protein